ncbi:MAG: hypothetical protein CL974_01570 [Euryarchaeota archaeon]|nr:hypothetical protein [Euryarchaeota archaeon]
MDQLKHIESLCQVLYMGSGTPAECQAAQQEIMRLQSNSDFIPQCEFILDNSTMSYAQLLASNSLETLITSFWNNFSATQKLEIRNYVLNYLANRAQSLQEFVVLSLAKLACRITKLGWFDSDEFRKITDEVSKFLDATVDHHIIGLRVLNSLVEEMNLPTTGRTLTLHRKTAVSFRDTSLLKVFQLAITTLRNIKSQGFNQVAGTQETPQHRMCNFALSMANSCLSFDFIGTNPEESAEDVGTVQVPSSWRSLVQDTATLQLFFDIYANTEPPRSNQALECLVQLSSVRRSLFSSEKERTAFLQALMTGIHDVLTSQRGLQHVNNYHQFCRLLGRLKASYQLSELVKTTGFSEFLELARDFTNKSLQNWCYSMNSIHYLLALWGRLVAALPYLRAETEAQRQAQILKNCVLQVVHNYVDTMLASVETVIKSDGSVEDPLEDEGSLREQMDRLPVILRLQYELVAQNLMTTFEQLLQTYEQGLQMQLTPDVELQLEILEGKMTWLTYMVAAVIGSQSPADPRRSKNELLWDGRLSRCVYTLVNMIDFRLGKTHGEGKCDEKLEIAILHYFKSFKKVYMTDTMGGPLGIVPGGSPAHPLLSLALSYASGSKTDNAKEASETNSVFDAMGIGDLNSVMNIVVNKLCNNIKFWHKTDLILEQTLEVFVELVSSYSSSKTLLSLDTVNFLVHNHVGTHFPFLGYDHDNKYRITFYSALARLVFSAAEDLHNNFDTFIEPNLQIVNQLNSMENIRTADARVAVIGILRDIRGIAAASHNRRTYNLLFDVLHPHFFSLCNRVAEEWSHDPTVTTALLKFLQEFVHNKGQRIIFEQSSANGILLFRETSRIICSYGSRILEQPVQRDIYVEKYKGIRLMLNVLTCALSGNYVIFGIFELYNDKALQNALDVSLQMCLKIPLSDVLAYIKLSKAYFAFMEVLFRNHLDVLSQLGSSVFIQLLKANHEGLQSGDLGVSALCASTVDHIATYLFLNQRREKAAVQQISQHIASEPDILNQLMGTLFNSLLFTSHANHWAVTRPILSLLLVSNSSFEAYQEQLLSTQTVENHVKLKEEFEKLTTDIQRSVETSNRDRFTQKLTMFRLNVRAFLTM